MNAASWVARELQPQATLSLVLDNLVLTKFVIFTNNIYQSRKEAKLFPTCSQQVQFSFSSYVCMASSKRADKEIWAMMAQ